MIDAVEGDNLVTAAEIADGFVNVSGYLVDLQDNQKIESLKVTIAGKTVDAVVNTDGTWTAQIPADTLAQWQQLVSVELIVSDLNGLKPAIEQALSFDVDTLPPKAQISMDDVTEDNILNAKELEAETVTITGQVTGLEDGETAQSIEVLVNGEVVEATVTPEGKWTATVPTSDLNEGTNPIEVNAVVVDPAGNTADVTFNDNIHVDKQAPEVAISMDDVTEDNILNAKELEAETVTITGQVTGLEDGETAQSIEVLVNGEVVEATVTPEGKWTATVPTSDLNEGTNPIEVNAVVVDPAGNTADVTFNDNINVDTQIASADALHTITAIEGNDFVVHADELSDGYLNISGQVALTQGDLISDIELTFSIAGQTYTVKLNAADDDLTVNSDGSWTAKIANNLVGLVDGSAQLIATATVYDVLGNTALVQSNTQTFDISVGLALPDENAFDTTLEKDVSAPIKVESSQFLNLLAIDDSMNEDIQYGTVFTIGDAEKPEQSSESIGAVTVSFKSDSLLTVAKAYGVIVQKQNPATGAWEIFMSAPLGGEGVVASLGTQYALGAIDNGTHTLSFYGLPEGEYRISTYADESALTKLLTDIELANLGAEGTLLGSQSQEALLDTVSKLLGANSPSTQGLIDLLGGVLGAVNVLTSPVSVLLNALLNLPVINQVVGLVDKLVDSVVAPLVSNTLSLLEKMEVNVAHEEYFYAPGSVSANVLENDFAGAAGLKVTHISNQLLDASKNQNIAVDPSVETGTQIVGKHGVLTIWANGEYTYQLNPTVTQVGKTDVFSYTVSNGDQVQENVTLTIDINGGEQSSIEAVNDAVDLTLMVDPTISEQALASKSIVNVAYVGLGSVLDLGAVKPENRFEVNVAADTKREITFKAQTGGVQLLADFDLFIYKWNAEFKQYELFSQEESWFGAALLGGVSDELTYTLEEGQYIALLEPTRGVNVLFGYTLETTQDLLLDYANPISVAGQAQGNVITDLNLEEGSADYVLDTTYVMMVNGQVVQTDQFSELTVIEGKYGTLTIAANGDYTYTAYNTKNFNYGDVDSFEYTIFDPTLGTSSTAKLNVTLDYVPPNQDIDTVVAELTIEPGVTEYPKVNVDNPITNGENKTTAFGVAGIGLGSVVDASVIGTNKGLNISVKQGQIVDMTFSATGSSVVGLGNVSDLVIYKKNPTTGQYEMYHVNESFLIVPLAVLGIPLGGIHNDPETVTFMEGEYVAYLTTGGVSVAGGSTLTADSMTVYDYNKVDKYQGGISDELGLSPEFAVTTVDGQDMTPQGVTVQGDYGTITVYSDGSYTYVVDNTALPPNYGKVDTFSYITKNLVTGASEVAILNVKLGTVDAKADTVDAAGNTLYTTAVMINKVNDEAVIFDKSSDITANKNAIGATNSSGVKITETFNILASDTTAKSIELSLQTLTEISGYNVKVTYSIIRVKDALGNTINEVVKQATVTGETTAIATAELHNLAAGQYQVVLEVPGRTWTRQSYGYDIKVKEAYVDQWDTDLTENYIEHQVQGNFLDNDMLMEDLLAQTVVQFGHKVLSLDPAKIAQEIVVLGQYGSLTVRGDGSYTYTPNGKGGGKDIFVYNIVSPTGESDTATIEINVGKNVMGSSKADIVESGSANDIFTMGEGSDTVIFDLLDRKDAVGGNGLDVWQDFEVGADGDQVDVSALLEQYNSTLNLANFISVTQQGKDTVISIDRDGKQFEADGSVKQDQFTDTQLLILKDTAVSLDELLANNQILY